MAYCSYSPFSIGGCKGFTSENQLNSTSKLDELVCNQTGNIFGTSVKGQNDYTVSIAQFSPVNTVCDLSNVYIILQRNAVIY